MQLLRTIRKSRYYQQPWLDAGVMHADPLVDFNTRDNCLSLWVIEAEERNLDRVLAAIAGTREAAQNIDYALLASHALEEIGIGLESVAGVTPDSEANAAWHRNTTALTANQVVKLAQAVFARPEARQRRSDREIKLLLISGVKNNQLSPDALKLAPKVREELGI
jgi:hypothetical protein